MERPLLATVLFLFLVGGVSAASISTDKADYSPGETVLISGSGFLADTQLVQLDITRPDGSVNSCPMYRCTAALPTTDSEGAFLDYAYRLNGIVGAYLITASDGTNTVEYTFTDGAIWTTKGGCDTHDENSYGVIEEVWVNAEGLSASTEYAWTITGGSGGSSCTPGVVVASGDITTDSTGAFCFNAHTILSTECGEYKVEVDNGNPGGKKSDNYKVECADIDGDGYDGGPYAACPSGNDCDDTNASVHPGASENCNGVDDDCDGQTDENLVQSCGVVPCNGTSTCSAGFWGACSTVGDLCRDIAGVCDVEEYCSAADDPVCPTDAFSLNTTECRAADGVCDVAEMCTGTSADCPADDVADNSTVCRAENGECDLSDYCDGVSKTCGNDTYEDPASCYTGPNGTEGVGICESGWMVCSIDAPHEWGTCDGEVLPATEICNGLDDNCNGATDELAECMACTMSQGYWKTHSREGPAPYDSNWSLINATEEDTMFFKSGKTWYQVFWTAPAGNAYYNLAHQYMAAKLNILEGATTTPAVDAALVSATTLFNTYLPVQVATMKGKNGDAVRAQFVSLAGTLGSYNTGLIGPGHCDDQELMP